MPCKGSRNLLSLIVNSDVRDIIEKYDILKIFYKNKFINYLSEQLIWSLTNPSFLQKQKISFGKTTGETHEKQKLRGRKQLWQVSTPLPSSSSPSILAPDKLRFPSLWKFNYLIPTARVCEQFTHACPITSLGWASGQAQPAGSNPVNMTKLDSIHAKNRNLLRPG